ncbi:MAG TPA: LysR substrate-binding domain-containing protein [Kaistia sp.]|nr:LysR substrate-binding domain-containing protein [Kaistia sp.]
MINFSLAQVAAFIGVAETGSFRAAAERLHLSQPAVSARVRQLEEHLRVDLFNRTTRSVSLTPAGERLLHASARALGELEHLADELREEAGLSRGRIAIAAIPSIAATILPPAMAAFREAYPGVAVELVEVLTRRTFEAVEQGVAAIGLMSGPMPRDPFDFEPLFEDPCVAVVARDHPLAGRSTVSLDDLGAWPAVCSPRGAGLRDTVEAAFEAHGVALTVAHEANTFSTLVAMAAAGFGATFVPRIFQGKLDLSACAVLPIAGNAVTREVGIVSLRGRADSPAAAAFRALLRNRCGSGQSQTRRRPA